MVSFSHPLGRATWLFQLGIHPPSNGCSQHIAASFEFALLATLLPPKHTDDDDEAHHPTHAKPLEGFTGLQRNPQNTAAPAEGSCRAQRCSAEDRLSRRGRAMGRSAPGSPKPEHPAAGAVPGWHASREPAASTLARGSGLVSHFPCITHLNNNKKAIGLKFAGITRRSGAVSMCKRLIKIETRATSTDANYLGWQIKGSSLPAEGFITGLAKGAGRKGRGGTGGSQPQDPHTPWPRRVQRGWAQWDGSQRVGLVGAAGAGVGRKADGCSAPRLEDAGGVWLRHGRDLEGCFGRVVCWEEWSWERVAQECPSKRDAEQCRDQMQPSVHTPPGHQDTRRS